MTTKPLIFVVAIFLVASLVYSPSAVFNLKASPKIGGTFNAPQTEGVFNAPLTDEGAAGEPSADDGTVSREMYPYTCTKYGGGTIGKVDCCAQEKQAPNRIWCTTCDATNPPSNCTPRTQIRTEGGGTFEAQQIPTSNTTIPQGGGGTFEAQQAPVTPGGTAAPKIAGGFNTLPPPPTEEGAAGAPPPVDEGTQPPALTEEPAPPVCLEGQVLDEQTNLCVLEEPEVPEEEPGQSEPEGQDQSTEEGDDSQDGNDNNNN